jgi:cysteinyl-tRNA synthetase
MEALCDDLNVARAVAAVNESVATDGASACPRRELSSLLAMDSVLGVLGRNAPVSGSRADAAFESKVEALISRRAAARAAKDWAESDRIRDELSALGVTVQDGPSGASWTRSALR